MNNIFQTVKENISCMDAAEKYGLRVNRAGKTQCIFHNDSRPSMQLYSGTSRSSHSGFFCFSCGAKGSVIDLTAQLFSLEPLDAAVKICQDFSIPFDKGGQSYRALTAKRQPPEVRPDQKLDEEIETARQILLDYLRACQWVLKNYTPDDSRWLTCAHDLPQVENMLDILLFGDYQEQAEIIIYYAGGIVGYERKLRKFASGLAADI